MTVLSKTTGVIFRDDEMWGDGYLVLAPDEKGGKPKVLKRAGGETTEFMPVQNGWRWHFNRWANLDGGKYQEWHIIGEAQFASTTGKVAIIARMPGQHLYSRGAISAHSEGLPSRVNLSNDQLVALLEGTKTFQEICSECEKGGK